ncbi:MAG: hypothetical protein K2H56_00230 [Malacoplasma sp.]|nr:hypothetical protein [Malacoplasma sp.]
MESKLKVVFEVSKFYDLNPNDLFSLIDFIINFISNSNGITEFYFILALVEKEEKSDLELEKKFNEFKTKITILLKSKNFSIKNNPLFFGSILNPINLEDDNKLIFNKFFAKSKNEIELLNNQIILFYLTTDLCDYLHLNNFFTYFLNFNSNNTEREIKKISKDTIGVVDASNQNEISFSSINYEFLTFLENEENQ